MAMADICNREVVYALREASVQEAAQLMREHHVGALVVVDEVSGKRVPVGIVTDRDIVIEVNAVGLDHATITVGDIMDSDLVTVPESASVVEALEAMRTKGVRRLPVVDSDSALAGLVTLDDMLQLLCGELTDLSAVIAREQARETRSRK